MITNPETISFNGIKYLVQFYSDNADQGFIVTCPSKKVSKYYAVDHDNAKSTVTSSNQAAIDELKDVVIADIKNGRII